MKLWKRYLCVAAQLFCLLTIGCGSPAETETSVPEESPMKLKASTSVEQTLNVGTDTYVDSPSPGGRYAVVFEDEGRTGYFYALDMSKMSNGVNPIVDALQIYNVGSVVDRDIPSTLQIIWSEDGLKAALFINNYAHAVFDFEASRGYCRTGFPPPDGRWTLYSHEWDDSALGLFR